MAAAAQTHMTASYQALEALAKAKRGQAQVPRMPGPRAVRRAVEVQQAQAQPVRQPRSMLGNMGQLFAGLSGGAGGPPGTKYSDEENIKVRVADCAMSLDSDEMAGSRSTYHFLSCNCWATSWSSGHRTT